VLGPQLGPGGVQGGGLVGELPGLVQVPGPVRLVGGHGRAVRLHAGAVLPAGGCPGSVALALRGDAGSPAQHGGVVAAGDVAAVLGAGLLRRVGLGLGALQSGLGVR
jgi:hypothetical protein